jgi:uncharacterized protein with ParB-like and HNH nuclease domain
MVGNIRLRLFLQEGYIMKSVNVFLNTIDKVKGFVNVISTHDGDFDLSSDRYVVDAKSIMGIFSLDLGKTLRLDIHDSADADRVIEQLKDYIV